MTLYDKVKSLCDAKGISIRKCEELAHLGNGVIVGWKEGYPTVDNLDAVAKVFDTDITAMLSGVTVVQKKRMK